MKMRSTTKRFATKGKLRMPLAPTSRLGRAIADDIRFVASDVTAVVIPNFAILADGGAAHRDNRRRVRLPRPNDLI
jgi:hypothetical protein